MRIHPTVAYSLGILLLASLLGNVILITRSEDPPDARKTPPPVRSAANPSAERERSPVPGPVEKDVLPPDESTPAVKPEPRTNSTAAFSSGVLEDPVVAGVVQAQEDFKAFWKDMERLADARKRLEYDRYFSASIEATQKFLGLSEPLRSKFGRQIRTAVAGLARARADYERAKEFYPPYDKKDPASYQLYKQQRDANKDRYQRAEDAAVEGVISLLDRNLPRHVEFASSSKVDNWLEDLFPPQQ